MDDQDLINQIAAMAEDRGYQLGARPLHAHDHTIGQTYLWLHEQTGNKASFAPTQAQFDAILADPPTNSLEMIHVDEPGYQGSCQDRWCWADALFMAPRTWLKLSNATGDPRYFEMDADKVKTPETSGTGFITYGLAWGVNNGNLSDQAAFDAVKKGWAALAAAIDTDGMLHWVQQVGAGPNPVRENDTQLYGVGAFLLAASEMTQWEPATE